MTLDQMKIAAENAVKKYNSLASSKPKYQISQLQLNYLKNQILVCGEYTSLYKERVGFWDKFTIDKFDDQLQLAWREVKRYTEMFNQESDRLAKESKKAQEKKENKNLKEKEDFPSKSWIVEAGKRRKIVSQRREDPFDCYDNDKITKITATEGLREIERGLFNFCHVQSIILPCSLKIIHGGYRSKSFFSFGDEYYNFTTFPRYLKNLEIPSTVKFDNFDFMFEDGCCLQTLTIILNGQDEKHVLRQLSCVINEETQVYLKWDNFVWNTHEDERDILFGWKEELQNLNSQMQDGNGIHPFHRSGNHLLSANKFSIQIV